MNTPKIRKIIAALFAVCLLSSAAVESTRADDDCDVSQQLVCQLLTSAYIDQLNAIYGTETVSYDSTLECYLLCVPDDSDADSIAALASGDANVVYCHRNFLFDIPEAVQGSQPFVDRPGSVNDYADQPASQQLQLPAAQVSLTGAPVRVGILDGGLDFAHPLLGPVAESGFDYVSLDSVAYDEPGGRASGHGTFIAGLIHLVAPRATLIAYRVLDTTGCGDGYSVARAITQAVDDGCRVINLSFVMAEQHEMINLAIEYAKERDVMIVAAAGNDSSDVERFPAGNSYVLTVTSVDSQNVKSPFANFGDVDVCAPGESIYAPFPDTAFARWEGTSFAAPFVTGQVALLVARRASSTWNDLRDVVRQTSTTIEPQNPSLVGQLGSGLINPVAALAAISVTCGDLNESGGQPDISDLTLLVDFLFINGVLPVNPWAANVDGGGETDIADLLLLVDHLFISQIPIDCQP